MWIVYVVLAVAACIFLYCLFNVTVKSPFEEYCEDEEQMEAIRRHDEK